MSESCLLIHYKRQTVLALEKGGMKVFKNIQLKLLWCGLRTRAYEITIPYHPPPPNLSSMFCLSSPCPLSLMFPMLNKCNLISCPAPIAPSARLFLVLHSPSLILASWFGIPLLVTSAAASHLSASLVYCNSWLSGLVASPACRPHQPSLSHGHQLGGNCHKNRSQSVSGWQ